MFSFDRKSAFATSTPSDPNQGNSSSKFQQTTPSAGSHGTYPRRKDAKRDSGYSENIFRFRSSDSEDKLIEVCKAPPLALPEEFDDNVSEISIHSPAPGEQLVTPTEPKEMVFSQETSSVLRRVKPPSDTFSPSERDGRRLSANGQIWISEKKVSKSLSAVQNVGVEGSPADKKSLSANQQQWQSEEKMKRRSLGAMLDTSPALFSHDSNKYEQRQPLNHAISSDEPDCSSIDKDSIQAIIRKKTATVPKRGRPVSETDLDNFADTELIKQEVSKCLASKPPLPHSRKADVTPRKKNEVPSKDATLCVENNNNITKTSDISEVSFDTEKDTSVALLGFSGKNSPKGTNPQSSKNQVVTKAEVHLSMEGPSFHPAAPKDTAEDSGTLTSSQISERLSRATNIQSNLETGKRDSGRTRSLSPHDRPVKWVYPDSGKKDTNQTVTTKPAEKVKSTKVKDTSQLPCVKVLDDAISYIYAEAFALFGNGESEAPSPLAEKAKKKTKDEEIFSEMYEQPYIYQPGKPLPRLSEASEEGSEAAYQAGKENISNNNSSTQTGINTNSNNRHHTLSISSTDSVSELDMDSVDVTSLSNELDQEASTYDVQPTQQFMDKRHNSSNLPNDSAGGAEEKRYLVTEQQSQSVLFTSTDISDDTHSVQKSHQPGDVPEPIPSEYSSTDERDFNGNLHNLDQTTLSDLSSASENGDAKEQEEVESDSDDSDDTVIEVNGNTTTSGLSDEDLKATQNFVATFVQQVMNSAIGAFQDSEDHRKNSEDLTNEEIPEPLIQSEDETKEDTENWSEEPPITDSVHGPTESISEPSKLPDLTPDTITSAKLDSLAADVLDQIQHWVNSIVSDAIGQIQLSKDVEYNTNTPAADHTVEIDLKVSERPSEYKDKQDISDRNENDEDEAGRLSQEQPGSLQTDVPTEDQACTKKDTHTQEAISNPLICVSNVQGDIANVGDFSKNTFSPETAHEQELKEVIPLEDLDNWLEEIIENAIEEIESQEAIDTTDTVVESHFESDIHAILLDGAQGHGDDEKPLHRASSLSSISEESEASYVDETFQISEIPSTKPEPSDQESMVIETFTQIDLPAAVNQEALDKGTEPKAEEQFSKSQKPGTEGLIPIIQGTEGLTDGDQTNIVKVTQMSINKDNPKFSTDSHVEVVEPIVVSEQNRTLLTVPGSSTEPSERSITDENSLDMSWDSDMGPELTFVSDPVPSTSTDPEVKTTKPKSGDSVSTIPKENGTNSEPLTTPLPQQANLSSPEPEDDKKYKHIQGELGSSSRDPLSSVPGEKEDTKGQSGLAIKPELPARSLGTSDSQDETPPHTQEHEQVTGVKSTAQLLQGLLTDYRGESQARTGPVR